MASRGVRKFASTPKELRRFPSKEKKMKLEGWKAGVVLTASIIIILNVLVTIPLVIAVALHH